MKGSDTMDFILFNTKEAINIKRIEEKLASIDYYKDEQNEVGIFHSTKLQENLFHIIFYLNDEYRTGSKYVPKISTVPMQVYINVFVFTDKKAIFIQNLYQEYCNKVAEVIEKKLDIKTTRVQIGCDFFTQIIDKKANDILICKFENEDFIVKETEGRVSTLEYLMKINEYDGIYYLCFTCKNNKKVDTIISINKHAEINVKSNILEIVIRTLMCIVG